MKIKEKLIYDLIFSENTDYVIDTSDYINEPYEYNEFVRDIRKILKRSKVKIIKENLNLLNTGAIWSLKVKKQ